MSQFSKKNSSIGLYIVPEDEYGSVNGPVEYAAICKSVGSGSIPRRIFFLLFLSLVLVAAVEYSATDTESSTTPDSADSVAKDVATPDTTRGAKGTCSPESIDWGADDEVLEEWRLKNALWRAEQTHKSQTAP